jgi:FrmR/RcnR family transcriptional regulator, repressor of frmRAB operon
MGHVTQKRDKLLLRLRRLRGQLDAVERSLEADAECAAVLQTLVACRGAMNGLIVEVIEDHVRHHVVDPDKDPKSKRSQGTRELLDVLKTYLR